MISIIKGMIALVLILSWEVSQAMFVDCYDNDVQIYHGKVDHVYVDGNFIVLFDFKHNAASYLRTDCFFYDN